MGTSDPTRRRSFPVPPTYERLLRLWRELDCLRRIAERRGERWPSLAAEFDIICGDGDGDAAR